MCSALKSLCFPQDLGSFADCCAYRINFAEKFINSAPAKEKISDLCWDTAISEIGNALWYSSYPLQTSLIFIPSSIPSSVFPSINSRLNYQQQQKQNLAFYLFGVPKQRHLISLGWTKQGKGGREKGGNNEGTETALAVMRGVENKDKVFFCFSRQRNREVEDERVWYSEAL